MTVKTILITGSHGLIGTTLGSQLEQRGFQIRKFDLKGEGKDFGDVRSEEDLHQAIQDCVGIVHLAAVSRVIWGENHPELCWATNVGGLENLFRQIRKSPIQPWVVFGSSREVYGQPDDLPVKEEFPLRPMNIYGRSKVEGERLVEQARKDGMRACTIRLSNVFGTTTDHADRVIPAFARAAVQGTELRVDGSEHMFDFTHVDDVTRGIVALAELLESQQPAPAPIHFVSGKPTTLGELASLATRIGQSGASIRMAPPRNFDVERFYGSPARANSLLGWQPQVSLEDGLTRLIDDFRTAEGMINS